MKHTPVTTNDVEDICKARPKKVSYDTIEDKSKIVKPFIIGNLPKPGLQVRDDMEGSIE